MFLLLDMLVSQQGALDFVLGVADQESAEANAFPAAVHTKRISESAACCRASYLKKVF